MSWNWQTFGNALMDGQGMAAAIYSGATGKNAPWYDWLSSFNKSADAQNGLFGDTGVSSASGDDELALLNNNREWAEEQAQKQMDFQTSANKIAMDFSAAQADKERAFQTEMSNSAYQRAVADLKKAGLNPILAYSQGGASVPSVSSASGVSSAGAKASTSDTGYTERSQDLDAQRLLVNSAMSILTFLLLKK